MVVPVVPERAQHGDLPAGLGYRGTILESGYPRDDALSFEPSAATLDRIRRRLGVPAGDRIVLYAPTFRDGVGRMVSELDHEALVRALGPGTTLLIRGHRYTVKHGGDVDGDRVVDVTTYPDVTDLYLIADVCVTDYSSLMFDFTITGKPILFFVPDLAEYRDTMRGTYFDLGEVCPGPMLATTDQLVEALQSLPDAAGPIRTALCRLAAAIPSPRRRPCRQPGGRHAARGGGERGRGPRSGLTSEVVRSRATRYRVGFKRDLARETRRRCR